MMFIKPGPGLFARLDNAISFGQLRQGFQIRCKGKISRWNSNSLIDMAFTKSPEVLILISWVRKPFDLRPLSYLEHWLHSLKGC